jgi:hypothetical protein
MDALEPDQGRRRSKLVDLGDSNLPAPDREHEHPGRRALQDVRRRQLGARSLQDAA